MAVADVDWQCIDHTFGPFLTHLGLIGSLIFFFVTAPVRERLASAGKLPAPLPSAEQFIRHIQELMTRGLAAAAPKNTG